MSHNNNLFQPYTQGRWDVLWQILWGGFCRPGGEAWRAAGAAKTPSQNLPQNAPLSLCVRLKQVIVLWHRIILYWRNDTAIYYGPWKKRIDRAKSAKAETILTERQGMEVSAFVKNRETKKNSSTWTCRWFHEEHESTTACRFSFAKRRRLVRKNIEWKCFW